MDTKHLACENNLTIWRGHGRWGQHGNVTACCRWRVDITWRWECHFLCSNATSVRHASGRNWANFTARVTSRLALPQLFCFVKYFYFKKYFQFKIKIVINIQAKKENHVHFSVKLYHITCTFHTEQQKHRNDGKKGSNGINNDKFKRIVIGNEQNMENSSSG